MKHRPEGGARVRSAFLLAFPLCLFGAASAQAVVQPRSPSALDPLAFRHPDLYIRQYAKPVDQLPAALVLPLRAELGILGSQFGFLDVRTDRWGTLIPSRPLIPGSGVGNGLTWSALGIAPPADESSHKLAVWTSFRQYLTQFQPQLEIPLNELDPAPGIAVHEAGRIVQIHAPRAFLGVPVRDSYLKATLNGGNLVLLGTRNWAPIALSTQPAVSAQQGAAAVQSYVGGHRIARFWREPRLVIVPLEQGDDPEQVLIGQGLRFRLVWEISPGFEGDRGSWEALVDAQTAELLAFSDQNLYDRKVTGGIYPVSNDGQPPDGVEQPGFPMPFADVIQPFGTSTVTNSAGLVDGIGSTLRTSLSGPFIRMNDSCGPINEVAQCSDLDLAFGPGTDCVVPPGHSPGDTHASRSGFYELNRQTEAARALLPGNLWLQEQLTSNMNIDDTCNAFWDGQTINFFKSGGGCGNTGEIAAVFDHEWGHGLDDNDTDGAISSPGESIADIYGILRVTDSCFGRGFVPGETACAGGGYGDPCTNCSGVRDLDFAKHQSGLPHDIQWILSPTVFPGTGLRPAGGCVGVAGLQQGPCGQETHCEGMVAAETGWDLFARDLRSAPFNFDFNTALQVTTRNVYLGAGNIGSWYQCVVGPPNNTSVAGCNADGGYLNLLAVDDDNGNLTDGTPHMTAIFGAFNRHQIACVPPVGPTVQNGGCAGGPTAAPVLTVTASGNAAQLSWNAVGGAQKYLVFRTEGVKGCDFGKVQIAETTATQHTDSSGLLDGFTYFYSVMPVGSSASCQGRMSACASVMVAPRPSEAPAALAFHEVPNAFNILTGDGDDFLDNCEIAQFSFQVENAGTVDLQNVQLVRVTPISHPATQILTPLPSLLAATLTGGACGSPQSAAAATFRFVPQGLSPDDTLEFEFEVQGTSPSGTISLVGRMQRTGTESDFQFMASKTFTFETGLDGWKIVNGTYTRQSPGANATVFHLASSSLEEGQCDEIRSPEIRLSANSTLSLFNQFSTEPPTPLGAYDRANVGIFDSEVGSRTTVSPDGGRLYNVSGSGGVCVTQGQAGWAGAGPGFLSSSWSAAALQSGAFAGRRVRLDVTYGTDPLVQLAGFQFDEVTLTNIDLQVADTNDDVCGAPPQVVANDDSAATTLNTPVTINVVANDFTQNPPFTVVGVTDPPSGSAVNNGNGTVTYTPDPGFTGTDSFDYTVQDALGNSDSATVTVSVTGGVGPCAEPGITVLTDPSGDATSQQPEHDVQKLSIAQPSALGAETFVFTLKMASLASPTPSTTWPVVFRTPDGVDRFVKMATSPQGVVSFAHGTGINPAAAGTPADPASSFSADGAIRIVVPASALGSPQAGQQLTLFLVRIRAELGPAGAITPDNMPDSLTRSGSYDVANCNRQPEANDDTATTPEDTPVTIDVLANDTDPDGDTLTVTSVSDPPNGMAVRNADNTVTYTPDNNFTGNDSFTYTISDGRGGSDTATVRITVTALNRPDLVVSNITVNNNKGVREGDKVTIRATVSNTGNAAAPASQTEFRLDTTTVLGLVATPMVPAGGSVIVSVQWDTRSTKGQHVIAVTADKGNVVAESNEGNNTSMLTVNIQGNKTKNSSFEQPNSAGTGPDGWSGESTGAGSASWSEGGSDGSKSAGASGNGGNAASSGSPTWTSDPISVTPGEALTFAVSVSSANASSAATAGLVYLGAAGNVLSTVNLITAPLTTAAFTKLEQAVTIPAGVSAVRVKLVGFSPADLRTSGTVGFDEVGLFGN